jgi:hypothetical protein
MGGHIPKAVTQDEVVQPREKNPIGIELFRFSVPASGFRLNSPSYIALLLRCLNRSLPNTHALLVASPISTILFSES